MPWRRSVLPSLFAFFGMGAFSIGWNLWSVTQPDEPDEETSLEENGVELPSEMIYAAGEANAEITSSVVKAGAVYAGLTAAVFSLVLGNLGTVRMIWNGFQKHPALLRQIGF